MDDEAVKVIHVTTVPLSLTFIRGQAAFMRARGFNIEVVSSPGEELIAFARRENVVVTPVAMARRITPFKDIVSLRKLVYMFRKTNPQILHAHTPKGGLLAMISGSIARTPVRIYHMRGLPYMTAVGRRRKLLMTTERISCKLAHQVFCVSRSLRDVAIADRISPPGKIEVFLGGSGNGVDASGRFSPDHVSAESRATARTEFGLDEESIAIGFVGRLVRDKGINELAAAWKQIRAESLRAHLFLIGPLEPQDPIAPESLELFTNDPRVHLIGSVDDTSSWYPFLDLVVLPTYREGFPNVILEAAAMELPVVATCIPGCIDAVQDGVTGTLVPPREVEPLSNAIRRYLYDPDLRSKHGKAGRARVLKDFQQEAIWESIYQEYCRLLTDRGISIPTPEPAAAQCPIRHSFSASSD